MDKTQKARPLRPILGGSKNGTRPQRYSYWRVGYAAKIPPTLTFWVAQAGEYHSDKPYLTGDFENNHHHQIYYHLEGDAEICHANGITAVSPGDLLLIHREAQFSYRAPNGLCIHWFSVAGEFAYLAEQPPITHLSLGYHQSLATIFTLLRETLIAEQSGAAFRAVALVYELLATLEAIQAPVMERTAVYPDVVRVALSYLREHYCQPFVAEEVAAVCGVSASHLRFLFQKWIGESPHQSHTRYRIEMAEQLLMGQDISVKEVAAQLGYNDPYYFSRVFKKQTGVRPSQWKTKRARPAKR